MGYKLVDECEECDGRPVIKGECQVCGHFHARTYSEWLEEKASRIEDNETLSPEAILDLKGYLILEEEDFEKEEE